MSKLVTQLAALLVFECFSCQFLEVFLGHAMFHEGVPLQVISSGARERAIEALERLGACVLPNVTRHVREGLDHLAAVVASKGVVRQGLKLSCQWGHIGQ